MGWRAIMASKAVRRIYRLGVHEYRRLEGRGVVAGIAVVCCGKMVGRIALALGIWRASVAGDAIIYKVGVVWLGIGHPGRGGMAGCTILAGQRRMVGGAHNGVWLANVMAVCAGQTTYGAMVEMSRREGRRGVAVRTIVE